MGLNANHRKGLTLNKFFKHTKKPQTNLHISIYRSLKKCVRLAEKNMLPLQFTENNKFYQFNYNYTYYDCMIILQLKKSIKCSTVYRKALSTSGITRLVNT